MRSSLHFSQVTVSPPVYNVSPVLPAPSALKVHVGIMYQTQNTFVTPALNTSTGTTEYSRFIALVSSSR